MSTWQEYKKTFPQNKSLFDLARSGDLLGLRDHLSGDQIIDLNQKNTSGYTALMLAVYNAQPDFCETLLRSGVCVESTDNMNNSALMAASFKGNITIIKLLLDYGADPLKTNFSLMNAYYWALMFGRREVTKFYDQAGLYRIKKYSKLKSYWKFFVLLLIVSKNKIIKSSST